MRFYKHFLFISGLLSSIYCFSQEAVELPVHRIFSPEELQNDFNVFRERYEASLANLYLYVSKERLDKIFDDLYKEIKPMTAEEFYKFITPVSSIIKDGHSNIFPPKENTEYFDRNAVFFPFNIYWKEGRMFISKNLSGDTSIQSGNEIISINGLPAFAVMNYLLKRQVRDGENENYAVWILNHYFREYYSYHFGHPSSFEMSLRKAENKFSTIIVKALSKDVIASNREARYPKRNDSEKTYFAIDSITHAGIFKIKSWDEKNLNQQIEDVFREIKSHRIDHLIIDVRDNQGGDFDLAIYLLSYILQQPFQYFNNLESVESHNDTGQLLSSRKGKMLGTHEARKDSYQGKVYVLINGGCFSNTAAFCSRIAYYKRGEFIGEETGGNKVVFSGEFGLKGNTILPNTKIICENANYRMTVTDLIENTGHGVVPDYKVEMNVEDDIAGRDVVLMKAIELIYQSSH
ncbi:MAG TPA: S41 family peptidase [Saprospiraceae bacterium]|nr:S41 family peptidase [Saprospiraceae bacterium]